MAVRQGGLAAAALSLVVAAHASPALGSTTTAKRVTLTHVGGVARWAYLEGAVTARARPSGSARRVASVNPITNEYTSELFLLLEKVTKANGEVWLRVRLPVLPNNRTGWVRRSAVGRFHIVRTHLVVNRSRFRATLYRRGRRVFRTYIGVGQSRWPTPKGQFYIRNKLVGFFDPFYGPIAFGTSARSAVLTDWPGGGFIGIHGTSLPGILPGRVSHGCIRMPNAAIRRLARRMPIGTPLTIK